jgi:hypothetical protein
VSIYKQVLNSLQAIGLSEADSLLGLNVPVANRRAEWNTRSPDSIMDRGDEYVRRLHGDNGVLDKLDAYGTADLSLVTKLCYGFIISDTAILDAADTSLAFLTALIIQDVSYCRTVSSLLTVTLTRPDPSAN